MCTSCEFYYNDVTVTSLISIKYGYRNEYCAAIVFCGPKNIANQIHSEMHPMYGD